MPALRPWLFGFFLLIACDRGPASAAKDPAGEPSAAKANAKEMNECPGGHSEEGTCAPNEVKADANHFGAAFQLQKSEALGAVSKRLGEAKETVQVSGKVESVCQAKGCWMVLQDGDVKARIFTKGHGFFLPKTIAGRSAVVEGDIETRTIGEDFAKHLEQDKGGDPSKVKGPQKELVMNATAVALR
ncbi:MAG TPA: DUF4920 domain-containing protein [Polyangiaceae bacterium]|jgi:hypothetical protein|nr:DUF4920 domain-containing protein [Polyangiaceae bacterium]